MHITLINFLPERVILNRIGTVKDPQIEQEKKELTARGFSCGLFGGWAGGVCVINLNKRIVESRTILMLKDNADKKSNKHT